MALWTEDEVNEFVAIVRHHRPLNQCDPDALWEVAQAYVQLWHRDSRFPRKAEQKELMGYMVIGAMKLMMEIEGAVRRPDAGIAGIIAGRLFREDDSDKLSNTGKH